jgi:hypothetical protein
MTMTVLTTTEVDAELNGIRAVASWEVGEHRYPYLQLSAGSFELLSYALFSVSAPIGHDRGWESATVMIRGSDAGRDVLLLTKTGIAGLVQCKRWDGGPALPEVFREIAKAILYPFVNAQLPKIEAGQYYYLCLADDPAKTVVDFFAKPSISERDTDIAVAVQEVLEKYKSLAAIALPDAVANVRTIISTLKFKIVRPADLDGWLQALPQVAKRFFRHRILIDNDALSEPMAALKAKLAQMEAKLNGVPFVADVDLKVIRDRIEGTPESHRVSVGFASLFGYPREMFAGTENLNRRLSLLATFMNQLNQDYVEWLNEQAWEAAGEICDARLVQATVPPIARQLPIAFLGGVVNDAAWRTTMGRTLGDIVKNVSNKAPLNLTDADRLEQVRARLFDDALRYLAGDFSHLKGDLELKRKMIRHMLDGIPDWPALETAFEQGVKVMREPMFEAAKRLRALCEHKVSVFMMGLAGIDDPSTLQRMADSVKSLEAKKERPIK